MTKDELLKKQAHEIRRRESRDRLIIENIDKVLLKYAGK